MLKKLVDKHLGHRNFWRESFTDLSEIYVVMFVRGVSLSMMGLFVPIFLYKIGFSLTLILVILCIYFVTRVFSDIGAAYLVARFGPKHVIVAGQILFSISSVLFLTQEVVHWPIVLLGSIWGMSQSFFFIAYDVDFSKIKHSKHAGKELAYAEIVSRLGSIIGPLLGGVVSIVFGPQYIFAVSTVLLVAGLLPLFKTKEPVRTHQRLDYKKFPITQIQPQLPSLVAVHLENSLSVMMWPLFLAIAVLPGKTVFLKVGILSSISLSFAILSASTFGRLVDSGKGRVTLRISAYINASVHLIRTFVTSYASAFGVGAVNEVVTLGYRLPFFKAYYDQADDFPGFRIVFLSTVEAFSSFIKAVVFGMLAILSTTLIPHVTLTVAFVIASISSVFIANEKFKSLNSSKKGT